jgi:hypothetical protein
MTRLAQHGMEMDIWRHKAKTNETTASEQKIKTDFCSVKIKTPAAG